jgi:hypothetical protein
MTETVLLGNARRVKLREKLTRGKLFWDSEKFGFTNLPEADAFLRREYRRRLGAVIHPERTALGWCSFNLERAVARA